MKIVFDSEAELEAYIHNKFKESGVVCIDGSEPDFFERQFNCGLYGIADLVSFSIRDYTHHKEIDVTVYELKKEKITSDAFAQVSRYATGIRQTIEKIDGCMEGVITCVLVGPEIDESCYILNQSEFLFYSPYFNLESGVEFNEESSGWHRAEEAPIKSIIDMVSAFNRMDEPK